MKTFVKLCGLRDPSAVKEVPAGGAAGFVIDVPASPRNLTTEAAAELIRSPLSRCLSTSTVARRGSQCCEQ